MKLPRLIKLIFINLLILVALLCISEVLIRVIGINYTLYKRTYPGQYTDRTPTERTWHRKDPDLGWVCGRKEFLQFENPRYRDQKIDYRRNKQGFRCRKDFDALGQTSDKTRILMLGDSFLFGVFLSEDHTISTLLQKKLGPQYEVYNLGMPGWGLDQMYLCYKKYQQLIQPHIVIVFYIDIDVFRVFQAYRTGEGLNKPSFEIKDNKLVLRSKSPPGLGVRLLENSYLLNVFYRRYAKAASMDICKKIFDEFRRQISREDQKLVVIRFPLNEQLTRKKIVPLFRKGSITKPSALAAKLKRGHVPVSQYLKAQLSENLQVRLAQYDPEKEFPEELLADEFNRLIQEESLYTENIFEQVKLRAATRQLISAQPQGKDLALLNRMLLEDAYPEEILKYQPKSAPHNPFAYSPVFSFKEYFAAKSVQYLEIYDKIIRLPEAKYDELYLKGDMHPSAKGTRFIADYIIEEVFSQASSKRKEE